MSIRKRISRAGLGLYFRLGGIPFREHLDLLAGSESWPADRLADLRTRRLQRVLAAAMQIPFYRDLYGADGPGALDGLTPDRLDRLPVLEKESLASLRTALKNPAGTNRKTAGTSGLPSVVLADPGAQAAALAARARCYAWFGIEPGDREARFWGRPIERPSPQAVVKRLLLNRMPFDYRDVDGDSVAATCRRLDRSGVDFLYGYGSLVLRLCHGMERLGQRLEHPPKAAVLTAEATTESERLWMAEILGCPVVDEYGCSEVDIIAFSCPEGRRHIMAENVVVETVPARDGGELREIVVTDLNNVAMPMIRYRLGDAVTLTDEPCPCGRTLPVLAGIDGRSTRQYVRTPDGRNVHANPFPYFMEQQQARGVPLRQFQIRQTALDRIEVFLVLSDRANWGAETEEKLARLVTKYYGPEMGLVVHFVDDIRPVPGAKFEYFIALPEF